MFENRPKRTPGAPVNRARQQTEAIVRRRWTLSCPSHRISPPSRVSEDLIAEERVQRRLVAILAADVPGYSRLMREDEAGTLAQTETLREEVFDLRTAERNVRIVKTIGDGFYTSVSFILVALVPQ